MGPSTDFRQQRLPFGLGRAATLFPDDWRAKVQRWRAEDTRAAFIDGVCDQFREGGSEIKLHRPNGDPRLHLFVNGKLAGVFVERNGVTSFVQSK